MTSCIVLFNFSLFTFHFSLKSSAFTVLWCNGNTSDSGPEIPGSSPGRTTKGCITNNHATFFVLLMPHYFNKEPNNPRPNLNTVFIASRLAFVAAIFCILPTKLLSCSRFF